MSVHVDRTLRKGLRWVDLCGRARFNRVTDGPQEGGHLPRNGGGDHGLAFAGRHQPAIARAQTQLSLPGDRPDDCRQALLSDLQRPAQASRVTVGPGALDGLRDFRQVQDSWPACRIGAAPRSRPCPPGGRSPRRCRPNSSADRAGRGAGCLVGPSGARSCGPIGRREGRSVASSAPNQADRPSIIGYCSLGIP